MSLWVDKYRPRSLENLDYHYELTKSFRSLAKSGDFPHLLLYGPSGAGKKTRVVCILRELFGAGVEKIKIDARAVQAGSRKVEFNLVTSANHLEITPSDMGNQDRLIIQDLLKEVAQTQQVDVSAKKKFKVVVINEADSLTRDAQSALRRTMEKYSPNLRLILLANSTSNIISPIRSRTLLVRVPAPTSSEISSVLNKVATKEKVELPQSDEERQEVFNNISKESGRNLRKALLMFEAMYVQNDRITTSTQIPPPDWEMVINKIADDIIKDRNVNKLLEVRSAFYELISHCIPAPIVIKTLTFALMNKAPANVSPDIVECAAFYSHRLRIGSKAIFHLEAFAARVMKLLEEADMAA
ncbi:hypothetical protein TRICI_004134 [Trichomonascus ciferrii]|uniref:Replication factor C subunit 5 n=1 Tax=Trichomonascus ciferrii TaxID=44093 RepID=A0A642V1T0_9ASCO|nr:hypothetical protein TRICI_004134 [Trichomonascus ciferrii]